MPGQWRSDAWHDVTSEDWFFALFGAVAVTISLVVLMAMAARFNRHRPPGWAVKVETELTGLMISLEEYAIDNQGAYPTSLAALVSPDIDGHCSFEGCNEKIPRDPWKHEYLYEPPTPEHPEPRVASLGSDGEPGGEGECADIDSDQLPDRD